MAQSHILGKDHNWFLPAGMRAMMERSQIGFKKVYLDGKMQDAVLESDAHKWVINGGWTIAIAEVMVEVEQELNGVVDKVGKANAKYLQAVEKLRSEMKNDLAAISSSANKTLSELSKLHDGFGKLIDMMAGPAMMQAIDNSERLATSLRAISELQSHSITFAVLDKKPQA